MDTSTIVMRDGYDRRKTANEAAYRYMTVAEAKELHYGQHIMIQSRDGQARRVKVNGKPKTWKREPNRVEIPLKYGLYECDHVETRSDGRIGNGVAFLVVELKPN